MEQRLKKLGQLQATLSSRNGDESEIDQALIGSKTSVFLAKEQRTRNTKLELLLNSADDRRQYTRRAHGSLISNFDSDQMLNISSARDLKSNKSRKTQHTASISLQKLNPLNTSNLTGIASLDNNGYNLQSTRNRYSNKERQSVVFKTRPNSFERQQQFE